MKVTTPIDTIIQGDCREEMKKLPDKLIDAIVTDPPYELAFMGKKWDASGIAYNVDMWGECLRVLKPGGHLLAFGGARTYHRMACAIEDAGFEIRDSLHWVYSQGFPKSLSIDKALDKMAGAEREVVGFGTNGMGRMNQNNAKAGYRPNPYSDGIDGVPITAPASDLAKQWSGWGSALKPAHEPIVLARKPLEESTIAANVLKWSTGAINIDACRIAGQEPHHNYGRTSGKGAFCGRSEEPFNTPPTGRFPSNLIHDGSPEVMAEFAKAGTTKSGAMKKEVPAYEGESTTGFLRGRSGPSNQHGDSGSVARFFQSCPFAEADLVPFVYMAKASRSEREAGLDGMPSKELSHSTSMKCAKCGLPILSGTSETCQCEKKEEIRQTAKNHHPTVKPLALMQYLCKLITPPGGLILDPFGGSGTTGIAAIKEGFHYILIEQQEEYCEIARKRVAAVPARLDRWAEAEG